MFFQKNTLPACLFVVILCFSSSSTAAVYKCLDANDKVYFSDRQCDVQQKQTEIEIKTNNASPAPRKKNQSWKRTLQTREMERQEKKWEKKQREEQKKAQRMAQCEKDRRRLAKLEARECKADRNYQRCKIYAPVKIDENGKKVFVSEHEKQAEINRLKDSLAKNCK